MEDIPEEVKRVYPYITKRVWDLLNEYHQESIERLAEMDEENEGWYGWRKDKEGA